MALINTSKGYGAAAAKGIVGSATELRKILNKEEIHTLSMMEVELDSLIGVLVDPNKSTSDLGIKTESKRNTLITDLISSDLSVHGTAEEIDSERVFTYFNEYIRLLNLSEPLYPNKYQLGHEQGVATKVLVLLQDMSKESHNPIFTPEYKSQIHKAIKAVQILDNIDEKTMSKINAWVGKSSKDRLGGGTIVDLETVLEAAGNTMDLNIHVEKATRKDVNGKTLTVHLRPELTGINKFTGALAKNILGLLRNVQKKKSTAELDRILKNVDVFNMTGSRSPMQTIKDDINRALPYDKKPKVPKPNYRTTKIRVHRRVPATNDAAKALKKRVKSKIALLQTKILAVKNKKKFVIPTVTLKALINQSLAEFVKLRMRESNAARSIDYLRNQTGTFSESAMILTLSRHQSGAYIGTYTYQHEPYEIFEKENKLGSTGRDPRLYIEGAARDIATQVLKKQFKGLALESK